MAENRADYAIVVGVDLYPALGLQMSNAGAKAQMFGRWLTAREGGGLPAANVSLLLPEHASDCDRPGPQLWQVHRAMEGLGAGGGARAGRRLYACFVGCAIGHDFDDLALLLADSDRDGHPLALDLPQLLEYQRCTVTFDEFVLIADVDLVAAQVNVQPLPFAVPDPRFAPDRESDELLLVGGGIIPDLLAILDEEASQRGPGWTLEASELVHRLRSRQSERGGPGENLKETGRTAQDKMGEVGDQARNAAARDRERAANAGARMADRAHDAQERARHYGSRARHGLLRSLDEQPLVLGAIGLAIGAALGAALPPSETEDRLMGEARDGALRRATKVGRAQAEKARAAATAVASAAREEATASRGLTSESSSKPGPTDSQSAGATTSGQSAAVDTSRQSAAAREVGPGEPRLQ